MEIGDRHLAVSFDEAAPMTKRDLRLLRAAIAHIRVERRREGTESIACECESLLGGDGCAPTSRPGPTTLPLNRVRGRTQLMEGRRLLALCGSVVHGFSAVTAFHGLGDREAERQDRKSKRLNSSH